jgi:hypothetical protein
MRVSVPTIYNKTLTLANTEYSQALNPFISNFRVSCRDLADLKIAFTALTSGTTYISIPAGSSWSPLANEDGLAGTLTLYIQSTQAGVVVEIEEWR